jgi:predicted RNA binding protein YcfA (HicA-like mRNA interferase family)
MGRLTGLRAREVIAALGRAGFRQVRQTGSHAIFTHPDRPELKVTVPQHGPHDLKIGTLRHILKQAELTVDEFLKLL